MPICHWQFRNVCSEVEFPRSKSGSPPEFWGSGYSNTGQGLTFKTSTALRSEQRRSQRHGQDLHSLNAWHVSPCWVCYILRSGGCGGGSGEKKYWHFEGNPQNTANGGAERQPGWTGHPRIEAASQTCWFGHLNGGHSALGRTLIIHPPFRVYRRAANNNLIIDPLPTIITIRIRDGHFLQSDSILFGHFGAVRCILVSWFDLEGALCTIDTSYLK